MLLNGYAYFAYSRSLLGYGTILMGFPYDLLASKLSPIFAPDRRVDIWRSPEDGIPMRREAVYLLRMFKIYTRETDNMRMVSFTGRDPTDLLSRRVVIQAAGTSYTRKTDEIDDMMKEIVREQMLWGSALDEDGVVDNTRAFPETDFSVQANVALGPSVSLGFADRQVRDVVQELKDASFQLNRDNPANRRIYFDVVPYDLVQSVIYILDEETLDPILDESGHGILDEESGEAESMSVGFQFQTFADLRGQDRTQALDFSVENNNLEAPYYSQSFLEEVNAVIVKGFGRGDSREVEKVNDTDRINASRWNRREGFKDGSQEPDQNKLADLAYPELYDGRPKEDISAVFLNVPSGPDTPRSMYGLDWDLGDLVPISYAGKQFNAEISIVYVAIDENGKETITGRNEVSAESG
jgi:hypothetical protein